MRKDSIQHYAVVTLQHLAHPQESPCPDQPARRPTLGKPLQQQARRPLSSRRRHPSRRAPRAASSTSARRRRSAPAQRSQENSDVLVSAVISTYLLTHLHHVLQRANSVLCRKDVNLRRPITPSCAKCSAWMPAAWKMPRHPASATPTSRVLPEGCDRTACVAEQPLARNPGIHSRSQATGNVCMSEQSAGSQQRQSKTGDSE